jgi:hypothetical protein
MQLYRYFVSQSSGFCRHKPLCCFSAGVYFCKRILRYRLSPETFGYTLTHIHTHTHTRCIQKFPDWPPGARTANGTALRHWTQLYRCFVSHSAEFCRHNPLCCFSTGVCCCKHILRYRFSPETFGYTLVQSPSVPRFERRPPECEGMLTSVPRGSVLEIMHAHTLTHSCLLQACITCTSRFIHGHT